MAYDIYMSAALTFEKGGFGADTSDMDILAKGFTMSGDDYFKGTQVLTGTTAVALNKGTVSTPGICVVKNVSATSITVEMDDGAFTYGAGAISIPVGEFAVFRSRASAPYMASASSGARINYLLLEA